MQSEELLEVWLRLSCVIDNQRLVSDLPFNEALVCGLLSKAQEGGGCLTASELCAQTRILKSQMNAILSSLEGKGILIRRRAQDDRRRVELRLLPEGLDRYRAAHRRVLALVDRLIEQLGEETAAQLIPQLRRTAELFDMIQQEVL